MSETVTTIMELAAKRFERDATKLSAEQDIFDALGIDSMLAMELLTELEDHFDVEIPDYELQDVKTFADLADAVETRV